MATEFYNRNWRMPKSSNSSKVSNYSMSFDGTEYINCGNSINVVTANHSLSMWIKTTTSGNLVVCEKGSNDELAIQTFFGEIRWAGTNSFDTSSANINNGSWHHLAVVADGGSSFIYVDGVLNATGGNKIQASSNSSDFHIGSRGGSIGIAGSIDHVAIFDYALSASQVTALYGNSTDGVGNPMAITGGRKPIAYYPIGDYAAFNGSEYLVNNGALQDYVFDFIPNDTIVIPNTGVFTNASVFSISLWLNPDSFASGGGHVAFDTSNLPSATESVRILYYSSNTLEFRIVTGGSTSQCKFTTSEVDKWANFVMVFDGSQTGNDKVKAFKNGLPITLTYTGASLPSTVNISEDIGLGNFASTYANAYNGQMSNVQIFNTALSATGSNSVETLYNNGTPLSDMSGFTSLQGWWKLDASATFDGSNWSIPDDSSNSNTGTSSGMTAANLVQSTLNITTPYSRYALDFDGTNDYIDLGTISLGSTFSLSTWIKPNAFSASSNIIFGGGAGNYAMYIPSSTVIWVNFGGGFHNFTVPSISTSDFTHILFTRTGANGELFVNGVSQGTTSALGTNTFTVNYLGSENQTGATRYYFNGSISNVSIWNAALTSAQVTEIYNNKVPTNLNTHSAYSNLVSWWQLGENSSFDGTNWTVLDEKGTNNGTSANMTEADLVNGVGTSANGLSDGMGGADNIIGDAPYSTANAVSYGMGVDAKSTSVPS